MSTCTNTIGWKLAHEKMKMCKQDQKLNRIAEYNKSPTICKTCSCELPYEKRKCKFCNSSCAASFNNRGVARNYIIASNVKGYCKYCSTPLYINNRIYCNTQCSSAHKHETHIQNWKLNSEKFKILPSAVRLYLLRLNEYKCQLCGWDKQNPHNNRYMVQIDHIDGNSQNNNSDNLRVICPNCHSLTHTYGALNKGNGTREYRNIERKRNLLT